MEFNMLKHQETAERKIMVLTSLLCMLPGMLYGTLASYVTVALPYFLTPGNPSGIDMDEEEASWFASLGQPITVLGTVLAGFLSHKIGRRYTVLISVIVMTIGAVIYYFATNYAVVLTGSIVCGFGTGLSLNPTYTLINEISLIKLRGSLGSMLTLTTNCGYLYTLVVGMYVPVTYLPWVLLAPGFLFLAGFWLLPESHVWLLTKGRTDEARKTLQRLRGKRYNINPELKEIEAVSAESPDDKDDLKSKSVLSREFILPAAIISCLFICQAASGADTLCYYSLIIFKDFPLDENIVAILFQGTITLGYLASPLVMARINRRPQFVGALLSLALGIGTMGVQVYLPVNSFTTYLPIISLVWSGFSYGLGVGPVPFVLMSELFTTKYKCWGLALAMTTRACTVFIQLKVFGSLSELIGIHGIFIAHSVVCLLGAVFTFTVVPETRNKSIFELALLFQGT